MSNPVNYKVVSPELQALLMKEGKLLNFFKNLSAKAKKGVKSISNPFSNPVNGEKVALGASFTDENGVYGEDILLLNSKVGRTFNISLTEDEQNIIDEVQLETEKTMRAMANQIDASLATRLQAAVANRQVDKTSSVYKDIVDANAQLSVSKIPTSGRAVICGHFAYAELQKEPSFIDFEKTGRPEGYSDAIVGKIANCVVLVADAFTPSADPADELPMVVCHSEALAWAVGEQLFLQTVDNANATSRKYGVARIYDDISNMQGAGAGLCPYAIKIAPAAP